MGVVHSDKIEKVHNCWECEEKEEEVSSSNEESKEIEGLNLEDTNEDKDDE